MFHRRTIKLLFIHSLIHPQKIYSSTIILSVLNNNNENENVHISGLLSRWRSSGKSRSIEGSGGGSRNAHGDRTPPSQPPLIEFAGGFHLNSHNDDDSELDILPSSQRPQRHHLGPVSRSVDQSYAQMRRQRFQG